MRARERAPAVAQPRRSRCKIAPCTHQTHRRPPFRAGAAAAANPSDRARLGRVLALLVRGVSLVGLLAAAFGPWYSYTLLRLAYGPKWSETEAPAVLGCYSTYILLLAVNGAPPLPRC